MLVIGNAMTLRLAVMLAFLLVAACDTTLKPKEDLPDWDGEAPGLHGVETAPDYEVGKPVAIETKGDNGQIMERGYRVRLPNQRIVRTGEWTRYFPNGSIKDQGSFDQDQRSGKWSHYFQSGEKQKEGMYSGNNPVGQWTYYLDQDANPIARVEQFDENGKLSHRADFYTGDLNIPQVEAEVNEDGRPAGVVTRYDTSGDCWVIEDHERNGTIDSWEMYLPDGTVFARFNNRQYFLQGIQRRNISQRDAFHDAKARLARYGGKTRELE